MAHSQPQLLPWRLDQINCAAKSIIRGDVLPIWTHCETEQAKALIDDVPFSTLERRRAEDFLLDAFRKEFLVARGMIRTLIAYMFDIPVAKVDFHGQANQKARLHNALPFPLDINISHSCGHVACIFARDRKVGIDIEIPRQAHELDLRALAGQIMSLPELAAFRSLDQDAGRDFFYEAWRRKEALLKACGLGLSCDPRKINTLATNFGETVAFASRKTWAGREWIITTVNQTASPDIAVVYSNGKPFRAY